VGVLLYVSIPGRDLYVLTRVSVRFRLLRSLLVTNRLACQLIVFADELPVRFLCRRKACDVGATAIRLEF